MKNAEARILLAYVQKSKWRRSEFEVRFMPSITRIIDGGADLTTRQAKTLESIYRKSQGG